MTKKGFISRKATSLAEIDQAVKFNEPVGPDHAFYTDFSQVRGDYQEKIIYKILNVHKIKGDFQFNYKLDSADKKLLFLGGMRGSGKTSELAKYSKNFHKPSCFFVVTCNIDRALDMNDVEYMDILIFQLERLTEMLSEENIPVDEGIVERMQRWFSTRQQEIKTSVKGEAGFALGVEASSPPLLSTILKIFGNLKVGMQGSKERATSIRTSLKNRFPDFADLFNQYIEEANLAIRKAQKGQEILFIVDGLEKTMSTEMRRKIVIEESNRLSQIRAYTIFTLPIELMKDRQNISQFSTVESFPFVKIVERDGEKVQKAFETFRQFIDKRIELSLFESDEVIEKAIHYGGGSPRELLRILETAGFFADEEKGVIDMESINQALKRLANQTAQYLTKDKLEKLREIQDNNKSGLETPFDPTLIAEMLEDIILMEYNDGSYKRVNPIVELASIYKQYVINRSIGR